MASLMTNKRSLGVPAAVIGAISRAFRLDPAEAEPIQRSVHAVVRFRRAAAMVRLTARPAADDRLVRVATALAAAGVPVVRLLPGVAQPARAHGWSATAWRLLPEPPPGRYPAADLAGPLRALHAVDPPAGLPAWDLLGDVRERIGRPIPADWAPATLGASAAALRTAPAWPVLRRLRDLQLAVYRLAEPPPGDELALRVRTVLSDDDGARWHRFPGAA